MSPEYRVLLRESTGRIWPLWIQYLAPRLEVYAPFSPMARYVVSGSVETRGGTVLVYDRLFGPEAGL